MALDMTSGYNPPLNGRNYCLCCGRQAEGYGFCAAGTSGTVSCYKQVCVTCLESGCWGKDGKGCFGTKLAAKAIEAHQGCGHDAVASGYTDAQAVQAVKDAL